MREDNIRMLEDTLQIMQKGSYTKDGRIIKLKLSRKQMEECQVYLPNDVKKICKKQKFKQVSDAECVDISCENIDSYSMARRMSGASNEENRRVLVLNLANPVNPGGGVRRGARAQEEDLCRKSSLLLSLESKAAAQYYEYNYGLDTFMGSHAIILTPDVEIIKDDNGNLLDETVIVSVMTCAAPMLTFGMEGLSEEKYQEMVYDRICGMISCAAYWGYEDIVLGAFGCGAFANDAKIVSYLFYKALKDFNCEGKGIETFFKRICFAVLDKTENKYNYNMFSRYFNDFYRVEDNVELEINEAKKEKQKVMASIRERIFGGVSKDTHKKESVPKCIFFWHEYEENGYLSNWYGAKFVVDDFCYAHVEQYLMAQKAKLFHDAESYTAILNATSAKECKRIGRRVTPFDEKIWEDNRYKILKAGVLAKFSQNESLKNKLLATGDCILAEASQYDSIFGIQLPIDKAKTIPPEQWRGRNLLGKALMEVREELGGEKCYKYW